MRFSSKRGRPKQHKPKEDRGTLELQKRRRRYETLEPLMECAKRKLISEEQYQAGSWFAWLHSTQFGVVRPRTVQWGETGSGAERTDAWRTHRKSELNRALAALHNVDATTLVHQLCVYHERPRWLQLPPENLVHCHTYQRTQSGLTALVKLQHQIGAKMLVS